jgi:rubrerythrin
LVETVAAVLSHVIAIWGEKAMWRFGYLVEKKAVYVYTKLSKNTEDEKFRQINLKLREDEIPHLEFFKKKLGLNE